MDIRSLKLLGLDQRGSLGERMPLGWDVSRLGRLVGRLAQRTPNASVIDPWLPPGMSDPILSAENEFTWGPSDWQQITQITLDAGCVDAGNTPTTQCRRGLALGQIAATGFYSNYDPTHTDGTQICKGFLESSRNMLSPATGATATRFSTMMVRGCAKVSNLFGFDENARRQLQQQFIWDDLRQIMGGPRVVVAKTADYTVLAADNETIFTNQGASGAVNFTLPAIARGLHFQFAVEADQNLTITSVPSDTLVVFNDAAADTIAYSTSSKKIGNWFEVFANADATKWLVKVNLGDASGVETITT